MIKYQPEIDALRTLAVLPVILFHAGFQSFAGGYVGVDIFFVISGYLITGIINREIETGRFSILEFYERRVRRIIPALMFVLLASLIAGAILFLPYQLRDLSLSALSAVFFTSNIWFWKETGYFAAAEGLKPLLHTWSLGVEEQFYIFFPLLMAGMARIKFPRRPILLLLFVGSLALAAVLVHRMPSATFYLLPTRIWELMLGALIALEPGLRLRGTAMRNLGAVLGFALILFPIFIYTADTPFPGLAALPPCVGTALILVAVRQGPTAATRWMRNPILVTIGLMSYSLYLWHWPIFAFSRQYILSDDLGIKVAWMGIAAAFVMAWLSWKYVEAPFRSRTRMSAGKVFATSGAMAVVVAAMAVAMLGGLTQRFDKNELALLRGKDDVPEQVELCLQSRPDLESCFIGNARQPTFAVWGDSHSAAIGGAIDIVARKMGRGGILYAFNGCSPGRNGPSPTMPDSDRDKCIQRNTLVADAILSDQRLSTVILIANWSVYLDLAPSALKTTLSAQVAELKRAGKEVIILADLPLPGFDVPWLTASSLYYGRPMPASRGLPVPTEGLWKIANENKARLIPLYPPFCDTRKCRVVDKGSLLFIDGNHVSNTANEKLIAPYLLRQGLLQRGRDATIIGGSDVPGAAKSPTARFSSPKT